jgi:hypothetical protein
VAVLALVDVELVEELARLQNPDGDAFVEALDNGIAISLVVVHLRRLRMRGR